MEPIGADPDLRPETELAAIVEPGRGVPEHRRRVDLMQEFPSGRMILGHDRVAMMRAIGSDMLYRLFDACEPF